MTAAIAAGSIAALAFAAATPADDGSPKPGGHIDTPGTRLVSMTSDLLPVEALSGKSMDAEAGDIDGDGDIDLVVASEGFPNRLLLNDGTGKFEDFSSLIPARNFDTEDIALADLTGDGVLDIVFVSEDNETNEYLIGIRGGGFEDRSSSFPVAGTSNAVIAADVDGDGDLDIVIGNNGQNALLINDGRGRLTDATDTNLPDIFDITQDIEAGDIDGDGDLDLIVGNEDRNRLLLNNGSGVFTDVTTARLTFNDAPEVTREADLGDVDGDGDLDIYFANTPWGPGADPRDRLLINDGTGVFVDQSELRLPSTGGVTVDADFIDIDGDGDLDIACARFLPGAVAILINDGKGRFADKTGYWIPPGQPGQGVDIQAGDFDRDGSIDLFICHWQTGPDQILIGNAT